MRPAMRPALLAGLLGSAAFPGGTPVVLQISDSQNRTQGDTANADTLGGVWPADARVKVLNATLAGAFENYVMGVSATPSVGCTGIDFGAKKNCPGTDIGFTPGWRDRYPSSDLYHFNLAVSGACAGRGGADPVTCAGYVSSGTGSSSAGNVFTLTGGSMPNANTLVAGTGIPAGTLLASFGAGGNTRYVYKAGVSGFGLSFSAGTPGVPITVTKYPYS